VAYYTTTASGLGAGTHFEHRDWLGTERMRTSYNSAANPTYSVEGTFSSLPWGDGQVITGADTDAAHYAMLDHDAETDTDHAEFRQYANKQGRFFSPDPYDGSYDMSNPQSMNRYVYAMNNPLSYLDPSGLDACAYDLGGGNVLIYNDENGANIDCPGNGIYISTTGQVTGISLDANGDLSNYASDGALYNADGTLADVNPTVIVNGDNGSSVFVMTMNFSYSSVNYAPNNGLPTSTWIKATIPGTNYCGPGGNGTPTNRVDGACAAHDLCYQNAGVSAINNLGWPTTASQKAAIRGCDSALSTALSNISWPTSAEMGQATLVSTYFNLPSGYNLR